MARRIPLLVAEMPLPGGATQPFGYGEQMLQILRTSPPQSGLTLDEVMTAMEAVRPIEDALKAGTDNVVLTDEQWATLRGKLDRFLWPFADKVIVDFGLAIREATEIGTDAAESEPTPIKRSRG